MPPKRAAPARGKAANKVKTEAVNDNDEDKENDDSDQVSDTVLICIHLSICSIKSISYRMSR
jgi:hypothetical protein